MHSDVISGLFLNWCSSGVVEAFQKSCNALFYWVCGNRPRSSTRNILADYISLRKSTKPFISGVSEVFKNTLL